MTDYFRRMMLIGGSGGSGDKSSKSELTQQDGRGKKTANLV